MKRTLYKGHEWDYYFTVENDTKIVDGRESEVARWTYHRLRTIDSEEKIEIIRKDDEDTGDKTYSMEIAGDVIDDQGRAQELHDKILPRILRHYDEPKPKPNAAKKRELRDKIIGDVTTTRAKQKG